MRFAILSDIHANLEAFQAVLEDLRVQSLAAPMDAVVSLGDAVGYGPDPNAVVHLLRRERIRCIQGNHEQGVLFPDKRDWFNPTTRRTLEITLGLLTSETQAELRTWPVVLEEETFLAVHGCPPDDPFDYLFEYEPETLPKLFAAFSRKVCFVGHTHMLHLASWNGSAATLDEIEPGVFRLDGDRRYIVNVGSVGQPRDGTLSAKYVVWDAERIMLDVRAVPYDSKSTIAKIEAAGFPEINTRHLRG
ncbi:MAG: metallophosphoesterase [Desulfovibrionales bacterium]|nr:MAG: metallophosphoesterase [Desulfovibrionales bacterium]